MTQPLSTDHPLWQVTILRPSEGRGCLVFRVHHVISDGLGMLYAVLPMLKNDTCDVLDTIALPAALKGVGQKSTEKRAEEGGPKKTAPKKPGFLAKLWDWICGCPRRSQAVAQGVLSLIVVKPDAEIKINPPLSARKPFLPFSGRHRMTRFPPLPMALVKAVREQHGCTVNDVIMTAVTGAIRRYCAEDLKDPLLQDGAASDVECKCTMLLALPRPIDRANPAVSLHNNILTPMFKLPVGEPTPVGRLRRTVDMASFLKSMPYIMGINATTKILASIVPRSVMRPIVSDTLSKITCNVTSLPLMTVPVTIAGQELTEMYALFVNNVPQISFISYNGNIYGNIVSDPALIPDPVAFGKHLLAELNDLAKPANQGVLAADLEQSTNVSTLYYVA